MSAPADKTGKPAATRTPEGGLGQRLRAWREQHRQALRSALARLLERPLSALLTTGVMAVAIALPLGLALALGNVEAFAGQVRDSREIGVFLKLDTTTTRAARLGEEIGQRGDVAGVTLRTPDEGLAEFRAMSDLAGALDLLEDNPLPTVLLVQPRGDGAVLATALAALPEVEWVQHDALWRERLTAWLGFAARLVQVVAVLLGLGVLLVVGNTVRLDIGARRDEIAILQSLGATDGFVRRPFVYLGAAYGLLAGALALLTLAVAGLALQDRLAALVASYGSRFELAGPGWAGAALLLAGTTALGWLGARLASGHHLRQTRPTEL